MVKLGKVGQRIPRYVGRPMGHDHRHFAGHRQAQVRQRQRPVVGRNTRAEPQPLPLRQQRIVAQALIGATKAGDIGGQIFYLSTTASGLVLQGMNTEATLYAIRAIAIAEANPRRGISDDRAPGAAIGYGSSRPSGCSTRRAEEITGSP